MSNDTKADPAALAKENEELRAKLAALEKPSAPTQVDTSNRAHRAYCAKSGRLVGFDTPLDLQQALSMGHVTLQKPGEAAPIAENPARNYAAMDSESLRKLCVVRDIRGYMAMNRDAQIEALQDRDRQEAEMLRAGAKAKKEK